MDFGELEKSSLEEWKPCGKQSFTKKNAAEVAEIRNILEGREKFFPIVCYAGCGRNIFHLTTQRLSEKKARKFGKKR